MSFVSFLILLVISLVAAVVHSFGLDVKVRGGIVSFLSQWIVAYIGALYGSSVFGEWFEAVAYADIYILPALLGAVAIVVLAVDVVETFKA